MHIAIAGGHGQIALHLERQLAAAGHTTSALIRNPDHTADVRAAGAEPAIVDLEHSTATQVAEAINGADAVVFAAGAGPGSGAERKHTMDRDGALLLLDAARLAGVLRYVMVSSMNADRGDPDSDEVFQIYLVAKGAADAAVRDSELDWTIVRPGRLTDDAGTGLISVGPFEDQGSIPREDVAAVIAYVLSDDTTVAKTMDILSGSTPIPEAISSVGSVG